MIKRVEEDLRSLFSSINVFILLLVLPVYMLTIFGLDPIIQGLSYLPYFFSFIFFYFLYKNKYYSFNFILFWLLFLGLWILPSIINKYSGRLESDLIQLEVLFVHACYISLIIWSYYIFRINNNYNFALILNKISIFLIPLILIFSFKILLLEYNFSGYRYNIFGHSTYFIAEIYLIFSFTLFFLKDSLFKLIALLVVIIFLNFLEVRAAIIPLLFFLTTCYFLYINQFIIKLKIFNFQKNFKISIFLVIFFHIGLFYIYSDYFLSFINSFLYLDSPDRGISSGFTERLSVWKDGIESIKSRPFLGIGYWVKIYGYQVAHSDVIFNDENWLIYNNPNLEIHNAFIRIVAENGIILGIFLAILLTLAITSLINNKEYNLLFIMFSILFFLSFSTRHLTLNLLNIILYFLVVEQFLSNRKNI